METICKGLDITLAQFFSVGQESVELSEERREMFQKWSNLTKEQKKLLFEIIKHMN